jgi:hypothetical protein
MEQVIEKEKPVDVDFHLLHLPPINLLNINLYYKRTWSERIDTETKNERSFTEINT